MLKSNKSPDADQGSLGGIVGMSLTCSLQSHAGHIWSLCWGQENSESRSVFTTTLLLLMTVFIGPPVSHDTTFAYPFVPAVLAQRCCLKGCSVAFSSVTHFRWDMRHGQEVCRKEIVLSCLLFPTSYCFLRQTLIKIPGNFCLNTAF